MFGKTIYKRDSNGEIRQWRYEVSGAQWRTHAGRVGGTQVESGWTTCVPRSKPTAEEQALFEAEAEMGKKLDKDYAVSIAALDEPRAAGGPVMLAQKYTGWPAGHVTLYSQPKLDGMRCKVNSHGLWSRTGKPILSCPHIFAAITPAFGSHPQLEIDGELYAHEMKDDFPALMSILRKSKPTEKDVEKAASIVKYHVYDIYLEGKPFSERSRMLELFVSSLGSSELVFVPTTLVTSADQIDQAYATYLQDGYEGQIIRLDEVYERKRSKHLLKRKEFEEREFELVSIEEGNGNWAGLAKAVTFKLPDGRVCGAGIKGNAQHAKALLERAPSLIGKQVTVRYFPERPVNQDGEFTGPVDKNMPRFGVAIDFDRPDI